MVTNFTKETIMNTSNEQHRMRICYQHWIDKHHSDHIIEQLTIITYAMLLKIIDKSTNKVLKEQSYIDSARKLFHHGLQFGWINTQ